MRQSLGVLSVLLGIVALTIAFVVFRKNYSGDTGAEDLAGNVSAMEGRLASLRGRMDEVAQQNAALNQRLTLVERKLDADPASLARGMFNDQLNERLRKAVEAELDIRLKSVAAGTPARPPESARDANFDVMVGGLAAVIGTEPDVTARLRTLCERTRAKLNEIHLNKGLKPDQKKQQMERARAELVEKIREAVGKDKAPRLDEWKKTVAHDYSRRFFGLDH